MIVWASTWSTDYGNQTHTQSTHIHKHTWYMYRFTFSMYMTALDAVLVNVTIY